ncbi:MAG: amidohydrolase family protein [Parvularculaceae bacterium]
MARCALFLLAALATFGPAAAREIPDALARYVSIDADAVLLKNGTVHVGDGAPARRGVSVLIVGDRIAAVGSDIEPPAGAAVIDAAGKSVTPGFVGLHNHLHMPGAPLMAYAAPRLYLAGGVTTIQTAGAANAEGEIALARAVANGAVPGPDILPSAPYVTGPGGNPPMDKPATPAAARAFVRDWAERGARSFKLYRHVRPEIAAAVIDEAHEQGLTVTGHLCSLTYAAAAAMGIDRIEHGLFAPNDFVEGAEPGACVGAMLAFTALDPDGPAAAALIATLVKADVTLVSTLAILETGFPHRPQADERSLAALAPGRVEAYRARQARLAAAPPTSRTPSIWRKTLDLERRFVAAGGRLAAGPDTGRHVLPGYGDQRNFELLVEAGFSAAEAIRIMTFNGAEALGLDDVGLVRAGMRADLALIDGDLALIDGDLALIDGDLALIDGDLALIDGDLAADPSTVRRVETVFKAGVGYDPAPLIADVAGRVGAP